MTEITRVERRASKAGYHFINLYQQCPRKWWLHYGIGLVPTKTGKALIFGKAWHEACAVYLAGKGFAEALAAGQRELDACKREYQYPEDYTTDTVRMGRLLPLWTRWCDGLLANFDILETEAEHKVTLASGAYMTIRPDAALRHKADGYVQLMEHKTTGYSIDNMVHSVDAQDQATAYSWGWCRAHPDLAPRFRGVIVDVAYARVYKGTVSDTAMVDSAVVNRTQRDMAEFEMSMCGLFEELSQKYLAWKSDPGEHPAPVLFPRNGNTCSLFGCEYESVCRSTIMPDTPIGDDFEWDPLTGQDEAVLREVLTHGSE